MPVSVLRTMALPELEMVAVVTVAVGAVVSDKVVPLPPVVKVAFAALSRDLRNLPQWRRWPRTPPVSESGY